MEASPEEREAFGQALGGRVTTKGERQALARALGVGEPTILNYINGEREPSRAVVFAIEEALTLKPGTLSHHLGYLPTRARPFVSVEDAIAAAQLSDDARRLLLALYREARRG